MMRAEQILDLKVIEVAHGTEIGRVTGVLIDPAEKKLIAVAISGATPLGHRRYVPFLNIISVEHDLLTIPSNESLVDRGDLSKHGLLESLTAKRVLTEDGRELGEVKSYTVEPGSGLITSLTFGVSRQMLGGLWKTTGDTYTIEHTLIRTLGDNIIVDNSVPDAVGLERAA